MRGRVVNIFKYIAILYIAFIVCPINATAQDHTEWSYNLSIYEVNVRQYTKAGTFAGFRTHLDRLNDLGVGIIWFMPIHPIGVKNRLGSLGSYYSVKDYYGINPEFGTLQDFKALVDSIHAKGMYVVLDWVGNHTSWDNVLTQSHPEWYEKNSNGDFIPPRGTNWSDVIQLDYSKQELRNYMIDAMKFWITETKIDGFRCDAASFIPLDFWTNAITELKKVKPGIIMISEDDGAKYYTAGFDMTYAWSFYGFGNGLLKRIVTGVNGANDLYNYVISEQTLFPGKNYRMYFTSNHDENSWFGTDVELFGTAAEQFSALSLTFRSVPLIYGGQEAGLNHRLKFFDKDEIIWQPHPMAERYKTLLLLKRKHSVLWNGANGKEPVRITTSYDQSIFAFTRQNEKDKIFALFNLSNQERTFTLTGNSYSGAYRDVFNDKSVSLSENYQTSLPAWGYQILEKEGASDTVIVNDLLPQTFFLSQNYPNPFNPTTTIKFAVKTNEYVILKVYNLLGEEAATLVNEELAQGSYRVLFDGKTLSSGMYLYRITAGNYVETKRMLFLK